MTFDSTEDIERLLKLALALSARARQEIFAEAGLDPDTRLELESRLEAAAAASTRGDGTARPIDALDFALVGRRLGAYEIHGVLGTGAMGVVYRAHDSRLDRDLAIKVLSPRLTSDAAAKRRFLQEAKAASALDHPNICTVYEINETPDGELYLAMAYYDGGSLSARIARSPLPVGDAVDLAIQIGRGLERAHAAGIIHRDIKPGNVMLTSTGVAKIVDFGIAKLTTGDTLTADGVLLGTVAYMAPELLRGERADARADIWALGVVLYEMLAGRRPFRGETLEATAAAVLTSTPRSLKEFRHDVPRPLLAAVGGCLEKSRADRYATAGIALDSLHQVAAGKDVESTTAPPVIAVLPFIDLSSARDQGYLCEGIAEEIINALAGVPGLNVVSRTSSFQAGARGFDLSEMATRLRADLVLEGSVRKRNEQLRVTAQLIDVRDGSPVWSRRYDKEIENIYDVQEEIARAVVQTVRGQLFAGRRILVKRSTANIQAYMAYMRGRHFRYSRYQGPTAGQCFEEAVRHDPTYAPAWAGLGQSAIMAGFLLQRPHGDASARARAAIERALTLDNSLAEAYDALARIRFWFDFDWAGAEREFQHALQLDPASADSYAGYASFLGFMGRTDDALVQVTRAQELDPLSAHAFGTAGVALLIGRRYEDAIAACRHALELQPDAALALAYLSFSLQACSRYDEALETIKRVPENAQGGVYRGLLGRALALAGHEDEARRILANSRERSASDFVAPFSLAYICAGLGELEECVNHLEKVFSDRSPGAVYLQFPAFDAVRDDPRVEALREQIKLPLPPRRLDP